MGDPTGLGAGTVIRSITEDDTPALKTFECAVLGHPWSVFVEEAVRDLDRALATRMFIDSLGLWVGDELVAVEAWKVERDPVTVRLYGDTVWHNGLLAVRHGHRRRGYAITLKRLLIARAREAHIRAITSLVDWDNTPMLELNKCLGAAIRQEMRTFGPDSQVCRCIVPISPA